MTYFTHTFYTYFTRNVSRNRWKLGNGIVLMGIEFSYCPNGNSVPSFHLSTLIRARYSIKLNKMYNFK